MATAADSYASSDPGHRPGFRERHPADAMFFPVIVAVVWLLMLAGFVPEVVERSVGNARPYPIIIHIHAVVFFGWLAFLASQVALVRTGHIRWHRRMGVVGVGLTVAVAIVGPAAALTMHITHQSRQPPPFLAVQLLNIAAFVGLIAAGVLFRRQPAAHKRLMVIGTLALIGAGFGRVIRMVTGAPPPATLIPAVYAASDVLLLAIALYDYRTRGRLHPVFLPAAGAFLAVQISSGLMMRWPAWIGFTQWLVS